jgi:molybdenum cofactor cytidylyltransferase
MSNPLYNPPAATKITAVILAAGLSSRMKNKNKLLTTWRRKPILRHVAEKALASSANEVIVITGNDAEKIQNTLANLPLRFVHNPLYKEGISTSLKTAINATKKEHDAIAVLLGDMPALTIQSLNSILKAFSKDKIISPTYKQKPGNPVVLPRSLFHEISLLKGDNGARKILAPHHDKIINLPLQDKGIIQDIDTENDLKKL